MKEKYVYSCGDAKITVSENGIIEKTENLYSIMWWNEILNNEIVGKDIIDFTKILKKYRIHENIYYDFIENVILPDYCRYLDKDKNKDYVKKII